MRLPRKRTLLAAGAVVLGALGVLAAIPDTPVGYVTRAGLFQAELLWGRVPLDDAREGLPDKAATRMDQIGEIKAFGAEIGLASSGNYSTINPGWDRTIYNVSACDPVRFRPVRWKFPIVGSVPYLGFFRIEDARRRADKLQARGYDVMVRTAGAYSTLGWFEDPVLPRMLKWSEARLADTLLHELAHATLWVPGSVKFNESFASFVGEEASMRYLVAEYGEDSDPVQRLRMRREDTRRYREVLHGVYESLDVIYKDRDRTRGDKLRDKSVALATIPILIEEADFHEPQRYRRAAVRGPWNNARLLQFRVYNDNTAHFTALLEQENGDLAAFIDRIDTITRGADDPFEALEAAVGGDSLADAAAPPATSD